MAKAIGGLRQMVAKLQQARDIKLAAMLDGIERSGHHVLGVSNDHAPIEEGTLIRSGTVSSKKLGGMKVRAAISYDTPYAVRQHEEMDYRHDAGRSAKFLENAMNSERKTVQKIIATRVGNTTKGV